MSVNVKLLILGIVGGLMLILPSLCVLAMWQQGLVHFEWGVPVATVPTPKQVLQVTPATIVVHHAEGTYAVSCYGGGERTYVGHATDIAIEESDPHSDHFPTGYHIMHEADTGKRILLPPACIIYGGK